MYDSYIKFVILGRGLSRVKKSVKDLETQNLSGLYRRALEYFVKLQDVEEANIDCFRQAIDIFLQIIEHLESQAKCGNSVTPWASKCLAEWKIISAEFEMLAQNLDNLTTNYYQQKTTKLFHRAIRHSTISEPGTEYISQLSARLFSFCQKNNGARNTHNGVLISIQRALFVAADKISEPDETEQIFWREVQASLTKAQHYLASKEYKLCGNTAAKVRELMQLKRCATTNSVLNSSSSMESCVVQEKMKVLKEISDRTVRYLQRVKVEELVAQEDHQIDPAKIYAFAGNKKNYEMQSFLVVDRLLKAIGKIDECVQAIGNAVLLNDKEFLLNWQQVKKTSSDITTGFKENKISLKLVQEQFKDIRKASNICLQQFANNENLTTNRASVVPARIPTITTSVAVSPPTL